MFTFSIIIENSFICNRGQSIYIEITNTFSFTDNHLEDQNDNNEFFIANFKTHDLVAINKSEKTIRNFHFHPQNHQSFVWQPPESLL
jgi:hypothetical protein